MADSLGSLTAKLLGEAKGTPDDTVKLAINGSFFEGWQSISIKRSMKAISGAFTLGVQTKWAHKMEAWKISPFDTAILLIGDEELITGYVDEVAPSIDADALGVTVSGRDKTGDMVDCSVDQNPSAWTNISLLTLGKRVASEFGVGITVDPTAQSVVNTPFPSWKINQGESAFETLDRAAKLRGILLTNDGKGNIVYTRAGTSKTASDIVQGVNMLTARARYDMKNRFSRITVKAQDGGLDGATPDVDFSPKASATDSGVPRFRPLMIIAEGAASATICKQRANWEVSNRVGKSTAVSITIPGWRQGDGSLWKPNQVCRVNAPGIGLNTDLLVSEVIFNKEKENTTTELLLEPASAYTADPTQIAKKDPFRQLVLQESARK